MEVGKILGEVRDLFTCVDENSKNAEKAKKLKENILCLVTNLGAQVEEKDEEISGLKNLLAMERDKVVLREITLQDNEFALDAANKYATALKQDLENCWCALKVCHAHIKELGGSLNKHEEFTRTKPCDIA